MRFPCQPGSLRPAMRSIIPPIRTGTAEGRANNRRLEIVVLNAMVLDEPDEPIAKVPGTPAGKSSSGPRAESGGAGSNWFTPSAIEIKVSREMRLADQRPGRGRRFVRAERKLRRLVI
jgi:hypothetical protein